MSTRTNFDSNLKVLKENVLNMALESQKAVQAAMEALVQQNKKLAEQVIARDAKIDSLEEEINNQAILLIAKEAPVAKDLRKIIVALRISSEVERIGDMAVNIAKSTLHIGNEKLIKDLVDIPLMMDRALEMFNEAIAAFYADDANLAQSCAEKDDKVDEMYGDLIQELMGYIPTNPPAINQITQLAFVCRYIERIADHTTNISENVVYLVTGRQFNLNA